MVRWIKRRDHADRERFRHGVGAFHLVNGLRAPRLGVERDAAVKFAAIGLGNAMGMFHLPALRRLPAATLAGGFDLSSERRAEWEKQTGTSAYASLAELLDRARPDVVIVATPPDVHVEPCLRALDAGCHVFCEKPLAQSVAEADR